MMPPAGPAERDALLRSAQELRKGGHVPEALAVLARLEALHPRFSRLFQERGHCHVLLRDAPGAIDALQRAVAFNPTLPASWDMLEQLYRMQGDTAQAALAGQHLALLNQLPQPLVVANSLFADGDFEQAEAVVRDYLEADARNVGALRLLARICTEQGVLDEAEALLQSALEHAPDYHAARLDYALVLLQQQKHLPARQQAEHLLRHDPENRDYLKQYAAASIGLGDHEPVIDIYARLLATPQSRAETAELLVWRANALKIVGRQQEAIADYRAALAAREDNGVAWFGLANLKTYRFSGEEIARMRALEARELPETDRIYLCFALGQALGDQGDYGPSWSFYERGNALRRATSRYRPEVAEACVRRLKRAFTAEFFASRAGWGLDDPAPVFVVGLPRSGSTLIEQILASHSAIEGTQELTEIGRYAAELCGADPDCGLPLRPEILGQLTSTDALALGKRFIADTQIYRKLGRPFFIDKMPNNFWHIGLIQLILPRAKIIDVRREPMACCFSNLKQLFGTTNQEYTYGIDEMARHYRAYLDLMRHWEAVLPGRVLKVHYEDVVDDLDASLRRILEHCGLPFEPDCLAFHENPRSVRTPSSEQVRRPIDRKGLAQWQSYARWLAPLQERLGDAITEYRN